MAIFENGVRTGVKRDGAFVAKMMQIETKEDGSPFFEKSDYHTASQINKFFGDISSKRKIQDLLEDASNIAMDTC